MKKVISIMLAVCLLLGCAITSGASVGSNELLPSDIQDEDIQRLFSIMQGGRQAARMEDPMYG